ncbi:3'(2'),5'-bisphosphate nucleotidase CysQ [Haloechinothrix sp. YIM 98757]|uniref:3'(2'),5'-bisphosphate nucleotidase CysQ n=1 Tax=Haloechinothrix aidingensis TaxID=2752311 RepID=A0A838AGJ7_9PSEU|nr:3'(2'),5'-bisphosphate nucleotidase CysQ [Haloechinothrix aidingensis]MBA0128208.1 3'(2'),5'-bisphosphate nucleotidase CysQ [Haloechinothrix aidingensis]
MNSDIGLAIDLAERAGTLLRELRGSGATELGARGDASADAFLLDQLARARPADAVLSEESADDPARLGADRVWIIDPLDGTREYAQPHRTDWAVHVALWERGREITAAAVAVPALDVVYSSGDSLRRSTAASEPGSPRIAVSESRPPACAGSLVTDLGGTLVPMGSAGAKAAAVLRGDVDAFVHAGGQYEWDSAAPAGVAAHAGLHASRIDGSTLRYNRPDPYLPDVLICRPELAGPIMASIRRG